MILAIKEPGARRVAVDGVLNVNKPAGWTSHDVVAKLRGVLKSSRIGHAGTLDPAATGVLPVLIGRATRIAEYLVEWDKEYRAVLRLGQTTDTLDAAGTILTERSTEGLTEESIHVAFETFRGEIEQVPPMYSAVKVAGVPLYKTARAGKTIERESRRVTVHEIQILRIDDRDVTFDVRCTKGTYVRTLCADIGHALGVGGHLLALQRRRVGSLHVEQSCTIDQAIESFQTGCFADQLLTVDHALAHMPIVVISEAAAERACHGVPVPYQAVVMDQSSRTQGVLRPGLVRLKDPSERLLAIGSIQAESLRSDGRVAIVKVLVETGQQVTGSH